MIKILVFLMMITTMIILVSIAFISSQIIKYMQKIRLKNYVQIIMENGAMVNVKLKMMRKELRTKIL